MRLPDDEFDKLSDRAADYYGHSVGDPPPWDVWDLKEEARRARDSEEALLKLIQRAAADIRHGLAHQASFGVIADVVARLEKATTPGAAGKRTRPPPTSIPSRPIIRQDDD